MISIVVPLFNEQDSLEELIRQIQQAVQADNLGSYEVLLIDDGYHRSLRRIGQKRDQADW